MLRISRLLVCSLAASVATTPALAWVYPEHRDIAVLAVQGLDADHGVIYDRLWREARTGYEKNLCAQGADAGQGVTPMCIDWAALSAIAGDHSCSGKQVLETVTGTTWILQIADVAAQLKVDLARIPVTATPEQTEGKINLVGDAMRRLASEQSRADRVNALRTADTRMQRADPEYATRAGSNLAHFMLARPTTELDPYAHATLALRPGAEINAMGVYSWYHLSALQKASRLAHEQLTPEARQALTRSALFDEAFALHFLEDMFASGHVAGSWGDVSQRKGTHDVYNQNGLEVFTWRGRDRTIVLMGDAHMRPQDAELAAKAVRTSLEQVLDAAIGRSRGYDVPHMPQAPAAPDGFDVCKNHTIPERDEGLRGLGRYRASLKEALLPTPVPGLGAGLGSMPRFRSELGLFVGLAGSMDARLVDRGFETSQDEDGWIMGLDLAARAGFGLEGALGDAGDGLVFAQIGFRSDSPSTNRFTEASFGGLDGNLAAAIPARVGLSARFRMPFYLVPGDLLFMSPLYLIDPAAYTNMAVTASNGGLIPWQQGLATGIGRFQFVLGRELGVTWYGLGGVDQLLAPADTSGGLARVVNFKSVAFDLPILEYRPYRAFSTNQSSSLLFQLFAGADVPYDSVVDIPPGASPAELETVWSLGLRLTFDWRYYF
jgi:hypothetical protein